MKFEEDRSHSCKKPIVDVYMCACQAKKNKKKRQSNYITNLDVNVKRGVLSLNAICQFLWPACHVIHANAIAPQNSLAFGASTFTQCLDKL